MSIFLGKTWTLTSGLHFTSYEIFIGCWAATVQYSFNHLVIHISARMKNLKSPEGMRETRSKLRTYFGNCQNIIFWSAAIVLTIVFIEQVSNDLSMYRVYLILWTLKMVQCLIKYWEFPTYISSRIVDQGEADFPAITVCPPKNGLKLDVLRVSQVFDKIEFIDVFKG